MKKEHQHVASLLQIVSDIERISDYCENISEYAENLANQKKKFSGVGAAEMKEMLEVCSDSFTYAVEAFEENSAEKALKVIEKKKEAPMIWRSAFGQIICSVLQISSAIRRRESYFLTRLSA